MAKEQRLILFSGTVQGVGFRYAAYRAAAGCDLTGYVRNLDDGRVECLVEGDAAEIDEFVAEIYRRMSGCIRSHTQQVAPHTGRYDSFTIAH